MTSPQELPYLTAEVPPIPGRIKVVPEDFRVDEIPAYVPTGTGDHLFVRFEKRDLTTRNAVERIARALESPARDAASAGLKDKHAVTTQWASFFKGDAERAMALELEGIRILEAARHGNKLRTGHLRGNRFVIRIREAGEHLAQAQRALDVLSEHGIPNYYGEQRFGRFGDNLPMAKAWLVDGGPAPKDRRERTFLMSVLQSAVFNRVLAERVQRGELGRYVEGDLLKKEDSGGLFTTTEDADASARVLSWAISPTGPMPGAKMRLPEREALLRENAALEAEGVTRAHFDAASKYGEGTRRALRVRPTDASVRVGDESSLEIAFTLPSGAYATVLLRELLKRDDSERGND